MIKLNNKDTSIVVDDKSTTYINLALATLTANSWANLNYKEMELRFQLSDKLSNNITSESVSVTIEEYMLLRESCEKMVWAFSHRDIVEYSKYIKNII